MRLVEEAEYSCSERMWLQLFAGVRTVFAVFAQYSRIIRAVFAQYSQEFAQCSRSIRGVRDLSREGAKCIRANSRRFT